MVDTAAYRCAIAFIVAAYCYFLRFSRGGVVGTNTNPQELEIGGETTGTGAGGVGGVPVNCCITQWLSLTRNVK